MVDSVSGPMDHHEKMRLRAAARHALKLWPGLPGEVISEELLCWEAFGYRLGGASRMRRLADLILKTPVSSEKAA